MQKTIFKSILLVFILFSSIIHANMIDEDSIIKNMKLGIDFGFGLPYEWLKDKSDFKASSNLSLGISWCYDFNYSTIYKTFKLGPEVGCIYGFTRNIKESKHATLKEKYIYIPISFRFFEYELKGQDDYFALGGSLGYEFNILLSSIYVDKTGQTKLYPTSQAVKDSSGYTVEIPNISGSIIANITSYISKSIYLGFKLRVPIEALKEKRIGGIDITEEFIRSSRVKTTSLVECYLGVDIMKWF